MTNGYFGGYIGKGQPAGQMEIKKCIDEMHAIQDKLHTEKRSIGQPRNLRGFKNHTSDTSKLVRSLDPISAYNTLSSEGQGADTKDRHGNQDMYS